MNIETLKQLLALSIQSAQNPSERILKHFNNQSLAVERKGDGSPVTEADREAETMIRAILRNNPLSAKFDILGEEFGQAEDKAQYRWLIDPIDGTRSFVERIPLFGTIVALEDRDSGKAILGVIHLPVLKMTYSAARGLGCFCNGKPALVSQEGKLETSIISTGDIDQFVNAGCADMFQQLTGLCRYLRSYTDCFGHTLVISGSVGAMIDPALNPWDVVATKVLIEEAGGMIVTRPSKIEGKVDSLFGSPSIVQRLIPLLKF